MTRGADTNHVYVATDSPAEDHVPHEPAPSAPERLAAVLARVGAEPTATETLRLAIREHTSLPTLIHEYETIAAHAVSIGIARWPQRDGRHDTRIAGLITAPAGDPPADYGSALDQRERLILAAVRATVEAAVHAQEPWTRATPAQMLEATALYRAKYDVTSPLALGTPPDGSDRERALDYQLARRAGVMAPVGVRQRTSAPTLNRTGPVR